MKRFKQLSRGGKIITIIVALILIIAVFFAIDVLIILKNGNPVQAPEIPRGQSSLGSGPQLKFLVMGDSTSIGQGTEYAHSFASAAAEHLALTHSVTFMNVGISGATASSVVRDQLAQATTYKPDVVVLAVGANDVTHFTSYTNVQKSIDTITSKLISANCNVKIVLTASPAVGSVPRFPFPVKQIMGNRVATLNTHIEQVISQKQLTLAPIAARTGAAFLHDPSLFAVDKFHPNTRGYALWIPVINEALDTALTGQPPHCSE